VTFYIQKSLALGPIRFGVSPRQVLADIDDDPRSSTGASGEFLGRRATGFYFADTRAVGAPSLPVSRSISSMPFLSSLRPADLRGWGYIALLALGVILFLLGFAVVVRKGAQGWIEVILGTAMIATPLVLTAQKRRQLRQQEEKERAAREERERREREMLASYVEALEQLRRTPSQETLRAATAERERLELPYNIWSPLARNVVLDIGFKTLDLRLMSEASRAVGLSSDDERGVRLDIYRTFIWHLLADDRLSDAPERPLSERRKGFETADRDLPTESQAIEEFWKLRGVTRDTLPRQQCGIPLKFREYCIHSTRGTMLNEKGAPQGTYSFFVTNKRLIANGRNPIEVELTGIDDVEVDIDHNTLTVTMARPAKPLRMQVEQTIYTAAIIDLATTLDERSREFA